MARIPTARPEIRKISARGLCYALAGAEGAYPVYQFSDVNKLERPNFNPFSIPRDVRVTDDGSQRVDDASNPRVVSE